MISWNSWHSGIHGLIESLISWNPWSMLAIILEILAQVQSPNVHDRLHAKANIDHMLHQFDFCISRYFFQPYFYTKYNFRWWNKILDKFYITSAIFQKVCFLLIGIRNFQHMIIFAFGCFSSCIQLCTCSLRCKTFFRRSRDWTLSVWSEFLMSKTFLAFLSISSK